MKALRRLIRLRIQRKYWVQTWAADEGHLWPHRDSMQHEAAACPCGPVRRMETDTAGHSLWVSRHWSLDAREAH